MLLLGLAPIVGLVLGFVVVLIPCLRIARKAGLWAGWPWAACLVLVSGPLGRLVLAWWSTTSVDRLGFAAGAGPYLDAVFPIGALLALWCFAFVDWPALRGRPLAAPTLGSRS